MRDRAEAAEGRKRHAGLRWLLVGCGGLFATTLAAGFGYLAWANAPLPPPDLEPEVSLPEPNGYDLCREAVANLPLPAATSTTRHPDSTPLREIRRELSISDRTSDRIRAALPLDFRNPPFRDYNPVYPELPFFHHASRRWTAEARLAREDGKSTVAMEHCLDAMELGSRIPHGGGLIHHLIGVSCRQAPLYQAELCIPRLSAPAARAAGRRLDRIIAQSAEPAEAAEIDRRVVLAHVRAIFRGQVALDRPVTLTFAAYLPNSLLMSGYPKAQTYRSMDAHYREWIAELRKPYPSQKKLDYPQSIFAQSFIPSFRNLAEESTASQAASYLLRLELALQEYRATRGEYPAHLEQLAPIILRRIPRDPFTTGPFRYRRAKRGYLLYSLAYDGKDDGGLPVAKRRRFNAGPGDMVAGKLKEKD